MYCFALCLLSDFPVVKKCTPPKKKYIYCDFQSSKLHYCKDAWTTVTKNSNMNIQHGNKGITKVFNAHLHKKILQIYEQIVVIKYKWILQFLLQPTSQFIYSDKQCHIQQYNSIMGCGNTINDKRSKEMLNECILCLVLVGTKELVGVKSTIPF